jgi:hypothetical protein
LKIRKEETTQKTSYRVKNNIRMDLRQVVWGGVDWMYLAEERHQWRDVVNTVLNLQVP